MHRKALELNPEVCDAIKASGHEPCSHGYRWDEAWHFTREEEAEPEQPHQVGGIAAWQARDSMRSMRTNGTSSHTAAVVMVEMRTRVV